jgi:hypothetical protein
MLQLVHHPSFISRLKWLKILTPGRHMHAAQPNKPANGSLWKGSLITKAVENFEHQSASWLSFASFGTLCLASNYEALQAKIHLSRKSSPNKTKDRTDENSLHFYQSFNL